MSDFMREVDEEYRRERAMRFLSRYQILIALVVVAIVVGAGVWRYTVDSRIAAAEADNSRFQAAEKAARDNDAKAAVAGFDKLAANGVAGYPVLSRMRAAEEMAASDPDGAAKRFDAIASDETGSQALRDTARFRGALLRADHEDAKAFGDRYGRYSNEEFTYRAGMRELLALAALKRDDAVAAQRYFTEIVADPTAPGALRDRAQAFLALARSGAATPSKTPAPPATVTQAEGQAAPASPAPPPAPATPALAAPAPAAPPAPAPAAPPAATPH